VEDHFDTARMMRRLLKMEGHEVAMAGDVATALRLADSQEFDLLISDLGLPDRSGIELMRELRARGSMLRGIALSGFGQEDDIRQSREVGFAAHLTKPANPKRLVETIAKLAIPADGGAGAQSGNGRVTAQLAAKSG
jgi:DNA-binding response OmpR family regulator